MKIPNLGWVLVALLALTTAALGSVVVLTSLKGPPISFVSTGTPYVVGDELVVSASVERSIPEGCTNNFQMDIRDQGGLEVRLPVPTRVMKDDSTIYRTRLADPLLSGRYQLRVRETTFCDGRLRVTDSPWLAFGVSE